MSDDGEIPAAAQAAFGDWALFRMTPAAATEHVRHEPSRRFLTEVGLPLQAPFFDLATGLLTEPETLARYTGRPEAGYGRLLQIGSCCGEDAWLDPDTGRVLCFFEGWDRDPFLVNSSLPLFLSFLTHIEAHRWHEGVQLEDLPGDDGVELACELVEAMVERLKAVDPPAFEPSGDYCAWAGWLDDPLAWGGMAWQWEDSSVEFLRRRGVEPTAPGAPGVVEP